MNKSSEIIKTIKKTIDFTIESSDIYVHEPSFVGSNAYEYVKECIDTGWVSSAGSWVAKFEKSISEFTGSKHVIAVSNGTVALRLSLFLAGVRNNTEVIIPPLSFVATANSVSHLGAYPHFVDIDSESLGMCPKALDKRLNQIAVFKDKVLINKNTGRRIAAVVPVHVFGLPANIKEIKKVCSKWNLTLVEDAAEALGSRTEISNKMIHCGCFGELGILSFNGNKIITTGGGGAILTDDANLASLAKHLSTTAKVSHPWDFYHDEIAWNDRLPNINAALGASQMELIENKIKRKRILHSRYRENFRNFNNVEIIKEPRNSISNYWLITMRLMDENPENLKEIILRESHASKIFLRPSWRLLNNLPMYAKAPCGDLSIAINQVNRLISLPSSPQLINTNN